MKLDNTMEMFRFVFHAAKSAGDTFIAEVLRGNDTSKLKIWKLKNSGFKAFEFLARETCVQY